MIGVILTPPGSELAGGGATAVPRILLPAGGRPLLEQQLLWLKASGVSAAVLCVGVGAELVRARFGDGSELGVGLRYLVEQTPLGTAGAVKALGSASLPDDILVLGGQAWPRGDGRRFIAFHAAHDALATLALHSCSHPRLCDPAALGPGQAIHDLPRRPLVGGYPLALSPAWIVRRRLLHAVADEGPCDFVRDVFAGALRRGQPLAGYVDDELLFDLSLPDGAPRKAKARR